MTYNFIEPVFTLFIDVTSFFQGSVRVKITKDSEF